MTERAFSRRNALITGATASVALPLLAACGADDSAGDASSGTPSSAGASSTSSSPSSSTSTTGRPTTPALAATGDIPVGGGTIFGDKDVVVTQPTAGDFKAFSATCTHMGCQVATVSDGEIRCNCHRSQFSIADGSVDGGPAPAPLPSVDITVTDGEIYLS